MNNRTRFLRTVLGKAELVMVLVLIGMISILTLLPLGIHHEAGLVVATR